MLGRYAAFQLPGIGLVAVLALASRSWLGVPEWAAYGLIALWVVVDLAMFPFVRVAYEPRSGGGAADLVGAVGTAQEAIDRGGYVRVSAELWRAELTEGSRAIRPGERVSVRGVRGLTLLVEPAERGGRASPRDD